MSLTADVSYHIEMINYEQLFGSLSTFHGFLTRAMENWFDYLVQLYFVLQFLEMELSKEPIIFDHPNIYLKE